MRGDSQLRLRSDDRSHCCWAGWADERCDRGHRYRLQRHAIPPPRHDSGTSSAPTRPANRHAGGQEPADHGLLPGSCHVGRTAAQSARVVRGGRPSRWHGPPERLRDDRSFCRWRAGNHPAFWWEGPASRCIEDGGLNYTATLSENARTVYRLFWLLSCSKSTKSNPVQAFTPNS
jgi:hypothetical protein